MDGSLIGSSPWGSSKLLKSESESEKETVEQPVHSLTSDAYLNKLTRVRMTSAALDKQIKDLAKKMKHMTKNKKKEEDNSDAKAEIRFQSEYAQAVLGIEFAKKKQEEILLERQIAQSERDTHVISQKELEERYGTLNRRYNCAGDDLWRSLNKKLHFENPEGIMLMQLEPKQFGTSVIPELLWPLYNTTRDDLRDRRERGEWIVDDLGERKKPSNWIADVFEYYSAFPEYHGRKPEGHTRWCHVTGMWYFSSPRVARIIPFLMDENKLEEIVFGSESESLQRPANALLLHPGIQHWLEQYQIVIVPVDRSETPIKRWRTEFIYPGLENTHAATDETGKDIYGKDVDGRELSFLGERRPSPRFLYFHFIMALIRAKDLGRENWQEIWARYYEQRPFPSPGNYMRKSMLKALATYFEVADMKVVESWMSDQGFDTQLQIRDDQVKELARRVHRIIDVDATTIVEQYSSDEELCDRYGDTDEEK